MKQPAWDQQETALLIETYVRIINNLQPRKDSVSALSELLRSRARKKGLVIDAQFRNINGINLRLYELEYIFSDGQRGVSNTSLLFKKMVSLYKENRPQFDKILKSAKNELKRARWNNKNLLGWSTYDYPFQNMKFQSKLKNVESHTTAPQLKNEECNTDIEKQSEYAKLENCEYYIDFHQIGDMHSTRPTCLLFYGNPVPVETWKDVYVQLCRIMFMIYPDYFEASAIEQRQIELGDRWISDEINRQHLKAPVEVGEGYYIETCYSAKYLILHCKKVVDECKIKYESVKIVYQRIKEAIEGSKDSQSRNDENIYDSVSQDDLSINVDLVNQKLRSKPKTSISSIKRDEKIVSEKPLYIEYGLDPHEYENYSLDDYSLSNRTRNRLKTIKVNTVRDLLCCSREDLRNIWGFGTGCFNEINALICKLNSKKTNNNYSIDEKLGKHADQIKSGNFSFIDEEIIDDVRLKSICLRYKKAYEDLGKELVQNAVAGSAQIIAIRNLLYDYGRESIERDKCYRIIKEIPNERLARSAKRIVACFSENEKSRGELMGKIDDESMSLEDFLMVNYKEVINTESLLCKLIDWCKCNIDEEIKAFIDLALSDERKLEIIRMRADGETLETIGEKYGLTRERVRQIEKKIIKVFSRWQYRQGFVKKILCSLNEEYSFTPLEFINNTKEHGKEMIYLLKNCDDKSIRYDKELDIFVAYDEAISNNITTYINALPDEIDEDNLERLFEIAEKEYRYPQNLLLAVFERNYKKTGRIYHKTRLTLEKVYTDIISRYYPDGIHIYSEHDAIRNYVYDDYGIDIHDKTDHAIEAVIARVCILRGRGVYKVRDESTKMSDKLAKDICAYIESNKSTVFMTNTLFTVFKKRLNDEGIDNKYYLQGLLRDRFEDRWIFKKDYIAKNANCTSIESSISSLIRDSKHPVSKDVIQQQFPGVTDVVINNAVNNPDIINLFGAYLHSVNLKISDDDISYLKSNIERLIWEKHYCSAKDLYNYIKRDYGELLLNNFINSQYGLFSVLELLFKKDYKFERPFITGICDEFSKPSEMLEKLVRDSEIISIQEIIDFAKEHGVTIYKQLDFLNSFNDTHLLIDGYNLATLDYTGIDQAIANIVEKAIEQEIKESTPISLLQCTSNFPSINVKWNAWLIYSVLKKWSTKLYVFPSSGQFKKSYPMVSPKGILAVTQDALEYLDHDGVVAVADDLNDIDALIEGFIEEELEELDEL